MPYITQELRKKVDGPLKDLLHDLEAVEDKDHAGVVNYIFSKILLSVFADQGYRRLNEASGVLMNVGLEFYRRVMSEYENSKIRQNGDIF